MRFVLRAKRGSGLAAMACSAAALLTATAARAGGTVTIGAQSAGPTPFIEYVYASTGGAALADVSFVVEPRAGSLTRPLSAKATASYLAAHGALSGSNVIVPVFGLYPGSTNRVDLVFDFTDGSSVTNTVSIAAPSYTDPCAQMNTRTLTQYRTSTSAIDYDFFVLRDGCSANAPAILDTDGNIRWVGTANAGANPGLYLDNGIYTSDAKTGVNRLDLFGYVTKVGDYSSIGVTGTGAHNIDKGRDGIIVDVDTTTQTEATAIEVSPTTGALLNTWDMSKIIAAAMTAGGDSPSQFVYPVGTDWFHMNAVAYNPADNTLIVSSRENFVIDVDYDTPADGVKKIHWILGDETKKWYQFPSLRQYALTLSNGSVPPIGQHAISVTQLGNLLLFDDGYGSTFQQPPGLTLGYSAARAYTINTAARTAAEVYTYSPQPSIYSEVCGSTYKYDNSLVVDFATADNIQYAEIQGIGTTNQLVFDLKIPEIDFCGSGYNASPFPSGTITYN